MSSVNFKPIVVHRDVCGIPVELCQPSCRILKVLVIRGSSLMKKDIFGSSDPYCRICLYRDQRQSSSIGSCVRTRTIKRTLNPLWGEEFYFRVNPDSNRLVFELFDENRITRDDFLGLVSVFLPQLDIRIESLEEPRNSAKTFLLRPRSARSRVQGSILVSLSYLPPSIDSHISQIPGGVNAQPLDSSNRLSIANPSTEAAPHPLAPLRSGAVAVSHQFPSQSTTEITSPPAAARGNASTPPSRPPSFTPSAVVGTVIDSFLPEGWEERIDQNGRTYYVDHIHKLTQWGRPLSQLPDGWEQRTDANGRVYYVDHVNHRTTWYSPFAEDENEDPVNLAAPARGEDVTPSTSRDAPHLVPGSSEPDLTTTTAEEDSQLPPRSLVRRTLRHGQAFTANATNFRHRPQVFVTGLSPEEQVQAAQTMYFRRHHVRVEDTTPHVPPSTESLAVADTANSPLPSDGELEPSPHSDHLSTSLPSTDAFDAGQTDGGEMSPAIAVPPATLVPDPANLPEDVTSNDGGDVVTSFSHRISIVPHDEDPLPQGWQMAVNASGRRFFINHNDQTTTWKDPRRKRRSESQISSPTSVLSRDAQRHDLPGLGPLPPGWEERIHPNGRIFYINHNIRTTQWEDPRLEHLGGPAVPYSRNYRQKYEYFRSHLRAPRDLQAKFEVRITRSGILEESFRLISSVKKPDFLMHRLWIEFLGEKGLDYGGVQREWFFLLSREMFNPYYGLFEYSAADNYTLQINPLSGMANENHLRYFKFIGRVCGMAVYHGKLMDGFFIRPFYKMMLGRKITLKDMESVDSGYFRSLKYILDTDPEDLNLTFSVDEEHFGETVEVELIPNGRFISVTNNNKREYIEQIINWRFVSRVQHQMCAFLEGFHDLIPLETLQLFDPNELELLMCGLQDISVNDWKANTLYKGEYHANHPVIINFWKTLYTFTNELRSRLLQFVTGTSRVPMNGFVELWGSAGPQKFTIEVWGSVDQLPRAHTCFNRLDLPPYKTFEDLRCKLIIAIENAEGFEGVD